VYRYCELFRAATAPAAAPFPLALAAAGGAQLSIVLEEAAGDEKSTAGGGGTPTAVATPPPAEPRGRPRKVGRGCTRSIVAFSRWPIA
jgi:hypothetical protein